MSVTVGDYVKCVSDYFGFTVGKLYIVRTDDELGLHVVDDELGKRDIFNADRLANEHFIKPSDEHWGYTEGECLRCIKSCEGFTLGNTYVVKDSNEPYIESSLYVIDDRGCKRFMFYDESVVAIYFEVCSHPKEKPDNNTASKDDKKDGKLHTTYIHPFVLYQLGLVMEAGARKYGDWNYLNSQGHKASQLVEAVKRHINKYFYQKEEFDEDTSNRVGGKIHHLACAIAGLNMLLAELIEGSLQDDRPHKLITPTTIEEMNRVWEEYEERIKND